MEPRDLTHVVDTALAHPWALTPDMLATVAGVLGRHLAGHHLNAADLAAAVGTRKEPAPPRLGQVAVVPIAGVIMPRAKLMHDVSGLVSYDTIRAQVQSALADPNVATILLDIDSPGGNVAGLSECCKDLLRARTSKRVVAHANFLAASAAYTLASAATEIVASPSAALGSVGIYSIHDSLAKALEQEGIERTLIYAGKFKVAGCDSQPLSAEARADLQARVDGAYRRMITDIAHGRGKTFDSVVAGYGEGRVVDADEAKQLGMVDRIESFDETLTRLGAKRDTPQEPKATGQDRAWARSVEQQLLSLGLP